jgi:hypothetical protein
LAPNFCPRCGAPLVPDAQFCSGCGSRLADLMPSGQAELPAPAATAPAATAPAATAPAATAPAATAPAATAPAATAPAATAPAATAPAATAPSEPVQQVADPVRPALVAGSLVDDAVPAGAPAFAPEQTALDAFGAPPPMSEHPDQTAPMPTELGVAPASRPARRLNRKAVVAGAAVLILVGVAAAAAVVLLSGGGPGDMARTLVAKLAARDATASSIVDSDASLRNVAGQMGLLEMPGSVTVSVDKMVVATSNASPSASGSGGDARVTLTYTLKWSGKGHSGQADQKLTATSHKGADGKVRLIDIAVSPTLTFDAGAYFGTDGTSADDANKVSDDLKAGTKWLSGVSVLVTPSDQALTLPDVDTPVPGHLTTWNQIVSPAVSGNKTSWSVRVSADGHPYLDFVDASKVTQQPVAAQVNVGSISPQDAVSQASTVDAAFWQAVASGDLNTANSYISSGSTISASAVAVMNSWGNGDASDAAASEETDGPEVKADGLVFVLASNGTWSIDSSRSTLVEASIPGNGHVEHLVYSQTSDGVKTCSSNITIEMTSVEFYTNGYAPVAQFKFTHDGDCPSTDMIVAATVGWPGNSGTEISPGVAGSDATTTAPVYRYVPLASGASPVKVPIWVEITQYGNPSGKLLPGSMTFSTV